jgi:hypothetical protein
MAVREECMEELLAMEAPMDRATDLATGRVMAAMDQVTGLVMDVAACMDALEGCTEEAEEECTVEGCMEEECTEDTGKRE